MQPNNPIGWFSIIDENRGYQEIQHCWWWEHNTSDTGGVFPWGRGVKITGVTYAGESSHKYDAMLPSWGT